MTRNKNVGRRCYIYTRYSTLEQKKGDSFNRQIKNAKKFAKSNGYILDDSSIINDEGVSAYRGDNITKGALGKFLTKVEKGVIPPSTILLVESFDRLSRENILAATTLFQRFIKHGIKRKIKLNDNVISHLIFNYTSDSGLREIQRVINQILRKIGLAGYSVNPIGSGHYNDSYYINSDKDKFVLRI